MNVEQSSTTDFSCMGNLRRDLLVRAHEACSLLDALLVWRLRDRPGLRDDLMAFRSGFGPVHDGDTAHLMLFSRRLLDDKGSMLVLSSYAFCLLFGQPGVDECSWRVSDARNRLRRACRGGEPGSGGGQVSGLSMFETCLLVKGYRKATTDLLTNLLHARENMFPVLSWLDMLPRMSVFVPLEHLTLMLGHADRLRFVLSDLPGEPVGLNPPYWGKVTPVMA